MSPAARTGSAVLLLAVATLPVLSRQYLGRTAGEIPIFMNAVDALWQGRLYRDAVFEYPPVRAHLVSGSPRLGARRPELPSRLRAGDLAVRCRDQGRAPLARHPRASGLPRSGSVLRLLAGERRARPPAVDEVRRRSGGVVAGRRAGRRRRTAAARRRHGRAGSRNEGLPRPVHPDPGHRRVAVERSPSPSVRGRRRDRGRAAAAARGLDAVVEVRGLPRRPWPGSGIAGGERRLGAAPHRRRRRPGRSSERRTRSAVRSPASCSPPPACSGLSRHLPASRWRSPPCCGWRCGWPAHVEADRHRRQRLRP